MLTRIHIRSFLIVLATFAMGAWVRAGLSADESSGKQYDFRIVQMSDTQPPLGQEGQWALVEEAVSLVNSLEPNIVLVAGDVTDNGTEVECKRMGEILSRIHAPMYAVAGNHDTLQVTEADEQAFPDEDIRALKRGYFEKYISNMTWSVELGELQFVGLEPGATWSNIPADRREWLLETCRAGSAPYKFLVTHFPPNPAEGPERRGPDRGDLYEALDDAGVVGYMHGHTHRLEAAQDPETGRLVFNSCSAVFRDTRGVMYYDVYGDRIVCFWKPVEGKARVLGMFDLKQALADVSSRREAAAEVGVVDKTD